MGLSLPGAKDGPSAPQGSRGCAPTEVQAIAWAAQKRLCTRYGKRYNAGKAKCQVTTAIARELVGFIWAIACEVEGKAHGTRVTA